MSNAFSKWRVWILWGLLCISGVPLARADDPKPESKIPQTLAELNRWYVEPDPNGAVLFLKAYQTFSKNVPASYYTNRDGEKIASVIWPSDIPVTNGPLPRAVKTSLAPYVRAIETVWPIMNTGAQYQSRYPVDLTEGWNGRLPYLRDLNGLEMGCLLRAISEADARHADAAVDSVQMGLSVAQSLKAEPMEISQDVRGNYQQKTITALEQVINRVALPPNALESLQNRFNQLEVEATRGDDFQRGLAGSKLIGMSYMDLSSNQLCEIATNLIENHWITNYTVQQIPELIAKGWKTRDADRKLIGKTFDEMSSIWKEDYPKRFEIDEIYQALLGDLAQRQFGFVQLADKETPQRPAVHEAGVIVRLRLAQTAVALERYRAGHKNQYPDSLSALAPNFLIAVPEDIFNGSPLQYHRRADGYVLYSVGSNRKDDGGARKEDIIFQAIHPPGRAVIE